jgi:hypothetical protein
VSGDSKFVVEISREEVRVVAGGDVPVNHAHLPFEERCTQFFVLKSKMLCGRKKADGAGEDGSDVESGSSVESESSEGRKMTPQAQPPTPPQLPPRRGQAAPCPPPSHSC